jgi:hypothetical protein
MGNRPWIAAEIDLVRTMARDGRTDIEIADECTRWYGRRTPASCYYQARYLGYAIPWTTRPPAHTPAGRLHLRPGNDERGEDPWHGAEQANEAFIEAMAREGRTPQAPSSSPGTTSPRQLSPYREGRPSSASGWFL